MRTMIMVRQPKDDADSMAQRAAAGGPDPGHTWWWNPVGDRVAHAFVAGAGWMRSICGDVRWSVALIRVRPESGIRRCPSCVVALTTGTPAGPGMSEGEAAEAWGR